MKGAQLNWFERAHFRSRAACIRARVAGSVLLTKFHLPAASMNAVVQWLIPPPKYRVSRLIPDVRIARKGKLAGMVVIQRGSDAVDCCRSPTRWRSSWPTPRTPTGSRPTTTSRSSSSARRGRTCGTTSARSSPAPSRASRLALLTREERDWAARIPRCHRRLCV